MACRSGATAMLLALVLSCCTVALAAGTTTWQPSNGGGGGSIGGNTITQDIDINNGPVTSNVYASGGSNVISAQDALQYNKVTAIAKINQRIYRPGGRRLFSGYPSSSVYSRGADNIAVNVNVNSAGQYLNNDVQGNHNNAWSSLASTQTTKVNSQASINKFLTARPK